MKITLKTLTIVNFKGIKDLTINFKHITNIFGDNATGKTSVFDSFLWLFFGKNSEYVSKFEVKRLDENNRFIKDLETDVTAILHVDQQEISVRKVLKQKWVRTRGQLDAEYQGDENIYYWNDVPCKESAFKEKIKEIVDEMVFKLITNPFHFNSLPSNQRRGTLVALAGNITDEEVLGAVITGSNKDQFSELIKALNNKKTLEEFKAELTNKKKKIKDAADPIPSRIDEVRRGMPEELDFDSLSRDLAGANEELNGVKTLLGDSVKLQQEENNRRSEAMKTYNQSVRDQQQKTFSIKTEMQNIEFSVKQKAKEQSGSIDAELVSKTRDLNDKEINLARYSKSIDQLKTDLQAKEKALETVRSNYDVIDALGMPAFGENEFVCPTCKQDLPTENIETKKEELTKNFNRDKLTRLENIAAEGERLKTDIAELSTRITNGKGIIGTMETEIDGLKEKITDLQRQALNAGSDVETAIATALADHAEYQQLKKDLEANEALHLVEPVFETLQANNQLETKRDEILLRIKNIEKQLADEELIIKAKNRIVELERQENELAQELANMEGSEYAILQFSKAKVEMIEQRINGMFRFVKFKMFNLQNNGGETECCDTLINGIPFSDANNAARINAGIDIINALTRHYQTFAPIFVDNRESVTSLIDSDSQIVNLIVSEKDRSLRVA